MDAAIEDRVYDPHLYDFTRQALTQLEQGRDPEIITNIFELQLLQRFGVTPQLDHCSICGRREGIFDYSSKYGGVLCQEHFNQDLHRYHADPKAIYVGLHLKSKRFLDQMQNWSGMLRKDAEIPDENL